MRKFTVTFSLKQVKRTALIVLMILCAAYIFAGTANVPFHGDESTLIYASRDYAYLLIDHDIDRVAYRQPPISAQEQELRLLNGSVSKMLYGLAWHLDGFSENDLNQQWDWGADWAYNQSTGHAPSARLLWDARIVSSIVLAAGVIPMAYIGGSVGGWIGALIAVVLYSVHPALLLNGRRAVMESALITFSLGTLAAGIWWSQRKSWTAALIFGISAGIAIASKHPAVLTAGSVFAACGILALIYPPRKRAILQLFAAALIMIGVFLLLNPAWWSDPLGAAAELLQLRSSLLAGQTAAFGGYPSLIDALGGFIRQTFGWTPQYYELPVWSGYIADQIARYESSGTAGLLISSGIFAILTMILVLIGVIALVRSRRDRSIRWVIGVWAAIMFASSLISPLEWQRYYLSAILAVVVLSAGGIAWLLSRLSKTKNAE